MQINTTKRLVQKNITQTPPPQEGGQDPGENPGQQDAFQKTVVDSLVSSPDFSKRALSKLGSGNSVTITKLDDGGVKVTNEGPSLAQKFLDGGTQIMARASQEVVRVMDADPAFAFKTTAEAVQTRVVANLDRGAADTIKPFILPVLRGGMMAMDTKRAISTYQNKDASGWEKGVDIGHVVTDAVGFAGAIGQAGWVPFLAPYANTMTGIGLVGDLASVTFHAMGYLTERGQVNLDSMDQIFSSKAAKREAAKAAQQEEQQQQPPNA
jgi:hypothetical protein